MYVANAQLEELDYRKLYQAYSSRGRKSAAEPRIMFKLLVYGYMCGIAFISKSSTGMLSVCFLYPHDNISYL